MSTIFVNLSGLPHAAKGLVARIQKAHKGRYSYQDAVFLCAQLVFRPVMDGIEWEGFALPVPFVRSTNPFGSVHPLGRGWLVQQSQQKDIQMHDKSPSFDPQFPYKLSDDDYNRLVQVHGMLNLLTDLTGYAKPDRTIDCEYLHTALWGLQDAIDRVVVGFEKQNADSLARFHAAHSPLSQSTHPTA